MRKTVTIITIAIIVSVHALAAHAPIVGEQALAGRLHGRYGAILGLGHSHQRFGAALLVRTNIQVVAHQMQERVLPDEVPGAVDRVRVAAWLGLMDKPNSSGVIANHLLEGDLVTRTDNDANLLHVRAQNLFEDDAQDGLLNPVLVNQSLERQRPLTGRGGRDDGFCDFHVWSSGLGYRVKARASQRRKHVILGTARNSIHLHALLGLGSQQC